MNHDAVRERVSDAYARAVEAPAKTDGACQSCCGAPDPKGEAAKQAGYAATELGELPPETVENSFGCGNPLAYSGVREGDVVLDLGSGAGIDLLLAARKVGPSGRVIGVDMTDSMIERARAAIEADGASNVEVRKGLIEDLPVETGSVDLVISNCVINLSPEKPKVFSEIARVLKPGGRLSVSDIVVERLPGWLRRVPAVYNSCVGGAIDEGSYLAGLRAAGLGDVEVTDRLVYEKEHLVGLALSEIPGRWKTVIEALRLRWAVRILAKRLAGRVWSARFSGRKPVALVAA